MQVDQEESKSSFKNICATVKEDKVEIKAPSMLHTKLPLFGDSKKDTNFEWKADLSVASKLKLS